MSLTPYSAKHVLTAVGNLGNGVDRVEGEVMTLNDNMVLVLDAVNSLAEKRDATEDEAKEPLVLKPVAPRYMQKDMWIHMCTLGIQLLNQRKHGLGVYCLSMTWETVLVDAKVIAAPVEEKGEIHEFHDDVKYLVDGMTEKQKSSLMKKVIRQFKGTSFPLYVLSNHDWLEGNLEDKRADWIVCAKEAYMSGKMASLKAQQVLMGRYKRLDAKYMSLKRRCTTLETNIHRLRKRARH